MKSSTSQVISRLSMSEVTTYRWSFEEDIQHYQAAGYQSLGVWRQKLSDFGEEEGIELLAKSGMKVSNLLWAGGFTGSDGRSYREAVEDGCHAVRLAGALNAGCLVVYPGGRNNHTFRHAERLFRIALDSLLSLAEGADVTLAIEPMHPACAHDWTFLTDIESTLALLERIDSPHLKLVFDTYHFGHDLALLSNLREVIPHIALVQLGDRREPHCTERQRCPLGTGLVPLRKIMSELLDAGYEGLFDIELAGQEFGPATYQAVLRDSRSRFARLMPTLINSGV